MEENEEVCCSICLDAVAVHDYAVRGFARLQCGHQFHAGCIFPAFIAKREMQCPNCRQIGNGPKFNDDELVISEDAYDPTDFESSPSSEDNDSDSVSSEDASDPLDFELQWFLQSRTSLEAASLSSGIESLFPFAGVGEFSDDNSVNPDDAYDLTPFEPSLFPFAGVSVFSDDDSVNPEDAYDLTPFEPSLFPFAGVGEFSDTDLVNPEDAYDLNPFEPSLFPFAGVSDFSMLGASAFDSFTGSLGTSDPVPDPDRDADANSSTGGLGPVSSLVNDNPDSAARQTPTRALEPTSSLLVDFYYRRALQRTSAARWLVNDNRDSPSRQMAASGSSFTDNGWSHEMFNFNNIISSLPLISQERLYFYTGGVGLLSRLEDDNPDSRAHQTPIMERTISSLSCLD